MVASIYLITVWVIVMACIYSVLTVGQVCELYVLSHLFFSTSLRDEESKAQ